MNESRYIYFDNSATSWPKPPVVAESMTRFITEEGGSAGRGSHTRAINAVRSVFAAREAIAQGHKIALKAIPAAQEILRLGMPVGLTTAAIEEGHLVHVHNVASQYLTNDEDHYE